MKKIFGAIFTMGFCLNLLLFPSQVHGNEPEISTVNSIVHLIESTENDSDFDLSAYNVWIVFSI
ncbi:hypothetical protein [Enterococcus timonensis]|uniref:hypothetical protein n=1 Tax=Enterococcus timonensis TaxID=1852364 RepID=UPI0008DADF79|nr:hypothetical protein [Enterococcus timonensis]